MKTRDKWEARPHKDRLENFKRKLKKLTRRSWSIDMTTRIEKLTQVIRGWIDYFRIGKMKKHMEKIDKHLRTCMRIVISKQWKTSQKRFLGLRKLGEPEWMANQSVGFGDHYQAIAKTTGLRKILKERDWDKSCLSLF
ncbi:group II intron maturase-specific domain-containing protein [Enterococcus hirae]